MNSTGIVKGIIIGDPSDFEAIKVIAQRVVDGVGIHGSSYVNAGAIVQKRLIKKMVRHKYENKKPAVVNTVYCGPCLREDRSCTFFPRFEDCECEFKKL